MGLDVYLYRNTSGRSLSEIRAAEQAWEEVTSSFYDAVPESSEEARTTRSKMADEAFAHRGAWTDVLTREPGSATWDVSTPGIEKIELDSAKYPDLMFKVGYWRSSYNQGGINAVLRRRNLPDLYELAGVTGEPEDGPIDWSACIQRTKATIDALDGGDDLDVVRCGWVIDRVASAADALTLYRAEVAKDRAFEAWSSRAGDFWPGAPQTVLAAIPGDHEMFLVVRQEGGVHPSYRQSLEVVIETCEYVLAQPNPQEFYLSWSG